MQKIIELLISAICTVTEEGKQLSWSKLLLWGMTIAAIIILAGSLTSCKVDQGYIKYSGKIVRKDSVEYNVEKITNNKQIIKVQP